MSAGFVYVIDPGIKIAGRSVVKIGMTTRRPTARLREIQTAVPHKIHLAHVAQFPNAKAAERFLHEQLKAHRVRNEGGTEFFFLTVAQAKQLVNDLAYKVSAIEARRALDDDLDRFKSHVSNDLAIKFAGSAALATVLSIFIIYTYEEGIVAGLFSLIMGLAISFFTALCGMFVGSMLVNLVWRREIAEERSKLLAKYPAAKDA